MTAIPISGIGWCTLNACGNIQHRASITLTAQPPLSGIGQRADLFGFPIRNGGRLDLPSRLVITAAALTLADADQAIPHNPQHRPIGIIGFNLDGSLLANRNYFQDYLDNGRNLGRGNLFLYTLPTSPLAETAIHFGLTGPSLHFSQSSWQIHWFLRQAAVFTDPATDIIAVTWDHSAAVAFYLSHTPHNNPLPPPPDLLSPPEIITASQTIVTTP